MNVAHPTDTAKIITLTLDISQCAVKKLMTDSRTSIVCNSCHFSVLVMFQIAEHCSSQAEASANDVRDRGRVEQCLKDHVAQKKITATSNKECFAVISMHTAIFTATFRIYVCQLLSKHR